MMSLLEQASRHAANLTPQTTAPAPARTVNEEKRKRALISGFVGVGILVAGIFVYRAGEDTNNLPGITSTGKTVGLGIMAGGGAVAALGFWQASR